MSAIDLEPELEMTLNNMAEQEHVSLNEIIRRLINNYNSHKQTSTLLTDIVNESPEFPCFNNKDSLKIHNAMRDENLDINKRHFLELIRNIKPVKATYSSEKMVAMLREGKEQLAISPITKSLVGLLAGADINESDYKQHLEDKYL